MESSLLARCRALSVPTPANRDTPKLSEIAVVLTAGDLNDAEVALLARPDPGKPYGRRVIIDTPRLEGMIAQWTRGLPCAPHDHGGSSGAVRVLRGEALHTVWRLTEGRLEAVLTERIAAGHVLQCGPGMIHSMVDAGGEHPLVTLHLYADPIDHMVVYDVPGERTLVVEGACGAWVPTDRPELVRRSTSGFARHI
ncbi:MAG: putative metal-dependent enzyme (double-stranded beta helix superfamily) [Myxococcota bacterium]|jgi:predicted metal-dependent enzyme (double-stranded beta helix superfamily)